MQLVTRAGMQQAFARISAAALCAMFAYAHLMAWLVHPRPSFVLAIAIEGLFALFILFRRESTQTSRAPSEWVVAFLGMALPMLLRPSGAEHDVAIGQAIQLFGSTAAVLGVLSLNRSAGIVPANRGIKTSGLYRFVRHPVYSAYIIAHAGYLASNFTFRNVTVVIAALIAQLLRIRNEERLLSADGEYVAYKARTRYRLIPLIY